MRSRLEPMKRVARMVKRHLWGILNAIVLGVSNAQAESINSKIQWVSEWPVASPSEVLTAPLVVHVSEVGRAERKRSQKTPASPGFMA